MRLGPTLGNFSFLPFLEAYWITALVFCEKTRHEKCCNPGIWSGLGSLAGEGCAQRQGGWERGDHPRAKLIDGQKVLGQCWVPGWKRLQQWNWEQSAESQGCKWERHRTLPHGLFTRRSCLDVVLSPGPQETTSAGGSPMAGAAVCLHWGGTAGSAPRKHPLHIMKVSNEIYGSFRVSKTYLQPPSAHRRCPRASHPWTSPSPPSQNSLPANSPSRGPRTTRCASHAWAQRHRPAAQCYLALKTEFKEHSLKTVCCKMYGLTYGDVWPPIYREYFEGEQRRRAPPGDAAAPLPHPGGTRTRAFAALRCRWRLWVLVPASTRSFCLWGAKQYFKRRNFKGEKPYKINTGVCVEPFLAWRQSKCSQ